MATTDLTNTTFQAAVDDHDIVLVDFWAGWCGPCQSFAPTYEKVSADHPDVVFGKVDTEAEQDLAAAFQIRSIPTLMVFRDNVMVFNQAGALPEASLRDLIDQVKALDMADVHRQIAAQQQSA
jgi:thioredoxin 1